MLMPGCHSRQASASPSKHIRRTQKKKFLKKNQNSKHEIYLDSTATRENEEIFLRGRKEMNFWIPRTANAFSDTPHGKCILRWDGARSQGRSSARRTRSRCSFTWSLKLPPAVVALTGRPTYVISGAIVPSGPR